MAATSDTRIDDLKRRVAGGYQLLQALVGIRLRVVTDPDDRRPFIEAAARRWRRTDVEAMLRHSPLIVLTIDDPPQAGEA